MTDILKRTIRGIRDSIPGGYIMGRISSGNGPAQLISLAALSRAQTAATGGGGGTTTGSAADFGCFFSGKPGASQLIFEMGLTKAITLPVDLGGSQFKANTPPLADYTVTFAKNGSNVGTVKFAATTGNITITFAAAVNFSISDRFTITGAASADGLIADIGFSFAATFI